MKSLRTLTALCISIILLEYGATTPPPPTRAAQQQANNTRPGRAAELPDVQGNLDGANDASTSLAAQSPTRVDWHTELVDQPDHSAAITDRSLRLDSDGHPHVAYGGDHLHYAWHNGTGWQYATVTDTVTASYPSLVLDSFGNPHISYIGNNGLEYAYWTGSAWNIQTVDIAGNGWTSIALNDANHPHISYNASGALKHAHWTGSTWDKQTVDSSGYGTISLALDTSGDPHIGYNSPFSTIKYAHWTGSAWNIQTVDSAEESYVWAFAPSLALDTSDRAHIGYSRRVGTAIHGYQLLYAHSTGSAWNIETPGPYGAPYNGISLALDAGGNPHISYAHAAYLRHTFWTGSTWETQVVGTEQSTYMTSLALDTAGKPHIIHYDDADGSLRYSYQLPPIALRKEATPSDGLHIVDTLTYTLTFSGFPASAQLWDPLPDSVDYITDSITGTVTSAAVYSPTARAIVWQGTLTDTVQTVRFRVTPVISTTGGLAPPIVNTAWLTDTTYSRSILATVIANGWHAYMPVVMRQHDP